VNAREVETVGRRLERSRIRTRDAAVAAPACALLGASIAPFTLVGSLALLIGAGFAALLALANLLARRDAVARLALDPSAYTLAEVRRYGDRLTLPTERQRLAAWLQEVVREAPIPGNWYLADRVARYAAQLESLANDLAAPRGNVLPASAAACLRLLTHATESPLYNPDVPAEELPAMIQRIRHGIST
jgi:hypothetical protein